MLLLAKIFHKDEDAFVVFLQKFCSHGTKILGLTEVQFSRDIENGNIGLKCKIMF